MPVPEDQKPEDPEADQAPKDDAPKDASGEPQPPSTDGD